MNTSVNEEVYGTTDRFDEIGVRTQRYSQSFLESKACFERSCMLCTMRKRPADCSACPIRKEFLERSDGWHRMKLEDYVYVEEERASC